MTRRSILEVTEDIVKLLEKEDEMSVKAISEGVGSQWRTAVKSLEFLYGLGIVGEKKGRKTNKEERLFFLVEKRSKYGKN